MPTTKSNTLENNIFLLIEQYLADPSEELENKIERSSQALTRSAFNIAKEKFPMKDIGSDEWWPVLSDQIELRAVEAASHSGRLVSNTAEITFNDPGFIFKLSADHGHSAPQNPFF